MKLDPFRKPRWWRAYSFFLVTLAFFLLAWFGQFWAQAAQVAGEHEMHGGGAGWSDFWPQFWTSTFENWQSEALQLCWQAAGLGLLYHWGSSQSREGDERIEAKLDELLRRLPAGDGPKVHVSPELAAEFRDTTLNPDQLRRLGDPPT